MAQEGSQATVAETIIQLAGTLGLRTTAEGIEDAAQLAVLTALGCTHGQGYYFSRPVSAAAMQEQIASHFPGATVAIPTSRRSRELLPTEGA